MSADDAHGRPPIGRPPIDADEVLVFSYGTLRDPAVQRELFGVQLPSSPDRIAGHRLDWVTITDPEVVRLSGSARHPILRAEPGGADVDGTALHMTADQLRRADDYEVDDYVRIRVDLASGRSAWVYTRRAG